MDCHWPARECPACRLRASDSPRPARRQKAPTSVSVALCGIHPPLHCCYWQEKEAKRRSLSANEPWLRYLLVHPPGRPSILACAVRFRWLSQESWLDSVSAKPPSTPGLPAQV